jgi:hypothetical protein
MDGKQQKLRIVKAECRDRLTPDDFQFIVSTLTSDPIAGQSISALLADPVTRDQILDDKSLFQTIVDSPNDLRISPHLYFYVLVRHALLCADMDDRELSDYVASMLAHFTLTSHVWPRSDGRLLDTTVDIVHAMQGRSGQERFALHTYAGNISLFMSGVFVQRIRNRNQRRAAPGVDYYERFGMTNFGAAREHHLADRYRLSDIYGRLSREFRGIRMALNDMTERLTFCGQEQIPQKYSLTNART